RFARDLGFRIRIPDGADESASERESPDALHDAGRAVHVHQLAIDPRGRVAWRPRARARARHGGAALASEDVAPRSEQVRSPMSQLAERTKKIAGSPTMKVTTLVDKLRREGVDVIDFGAGEPDFPTPDLVKQAAHKAIDANFTKYTPSSGIADL